MDIERIMSIGLRVLAGLVVGATVVSGVASIIKHSEPSIKPEEPKQPGWKRPEGNNPQPQYQQPAVPQQREDSTGDTLRNVQNGLGKMFMFIQALVGVTDGIRKLFQPGLPSTYSSMGPATTWGREFEARGGYGMRPPGSFGPGGCSISNPNDPFRFNPVDCGNAIPPVPGAWPGRTPDGKPFWKNNMDIFLPMPNTPHWF